MRARTIQELKVMDRIFWFGYRADRIPEGSI